MGLFKLNYMKSDFSDGYMERANKEEIDYEKDFENWLENSPHVLFDDEDTTTVLWIGRQLTASIEDGVRYPDLIGIDSKGNTIIVELKKGKTPREVIAQLLEYASWVSKLTEDELNLLALKYYELDTDLSGKTLKQIFKCVFYPDVDEEIPIQFNVRQKLFVIAEEITPGIRDVSRYLSTVGRLDITCVEYDVYKSADGSVFIGTERESFQTESAGVTRERSVASTDRWNGGLPVKEVVKRAVDLITNRSIDAEFSPKDVVEEISKEHPGFNMSTARCQLIQDCVNHNSRKHYRGGQMDYYYLIGKGRYRLYNSERDGRWNSEGVRIAD